VPTFAEAGYPELSVHTYVGMAAPRGTPPEVLQKIAADVRTVLASDEAEQKIGLPLGYTLIGSNPRQFTEFLAKERADAQRQIRALGVKLD
jgi:tripartite-type tricarboxylate transporter receptor subunit TctC